MSIRSFPAINRVVVTEESEKRGYVQFHLSRLDRCVYGGL